MNQILPAILPHSLDELVIAAHVLSFTPAIQLDLVDGIFASPASWPYEPLGTIEDASGYLAPFRIELDLMVQDPLTVAQKWHGWGVSRFVFHLESVSNTRDLDTFVQETGAEIGVSIANDMPDSLLTNELHRFSFVQVMGIDEVGAQGRPFDKRAIDRIRELRAAFPALPISVDGAVDERTLPLLKEAGADRFVVGSAILGADDPKEMYEKLTSL